MNAFIRNKTLKRCLHYLEMVLIFLQMSGYTEVQLYCENWFSSTNINKECCFFFCFLFLISCDVLFVYRFSFGVFFHFCQTSWLYIDCSDCITQWHYNINVLFVGDGYSSSLIMCCIISVIFKFSKGNYPDRFKVLVAGNVHVSTPLPRS